MPPVLRHIVLPLTLSALFFVVAATPVEVIGCRTRGLLAVLIALVGLLTAVWAAILAVKQKVGAKANSAWWLMSALLLTLPAVALLVLA